MNGPTDDQIESWYPRLYRTALRLTGSHADAADVTQQALLHALDAWQRFDGRSLRTTWLHSILLNTVRDWIRRQARRTTVPFDEFALCVVDGRAGHGAGALESREELAELRSAVAAMPRRVREAFVLTVLDGCSYREAGDVLGVPAGTIASRVHQARRQLRTVMLKRFGQA